jgi:hypothetical protein
MPKCKYMHKKAHKVAFVHLNAEASWDVVNTRTGSAAYFISTRMHPALYISQVGKSMVEVSTFWEGESTPILEICRKSWEAFLPEGSTVTDYAHVSSLEKTGFVFPRRWDLVSVQHRSDVLRLNCMFHHGGLWLDATTELFEPLQWILDHPCSTYLMPRLHPFVNYPENWLIYAPQPRLPSLEIWLLEFVSALELPNNKYEAFSSLMTPRSKPGSTYFLMYDSYIYLRNTRADFIPPEPLHFGIIQDTWFLCMIPVRLASVYGLDKRPFLKHIGFFRPHVQSIDCLISVLLLICILRWLSM